LTIIRYESGEREPRASDIKKLCEVLNVTEAELLNGPAANEFRVTLKYVKTLEGVNEEMNTDGISLLISDDGFVGVSGGRKLETPEDIDLVVSEVRRKLTFGYEHKDELKGA
jgi:transcriptional regulator with XRE-family HTH domain